MLQPNQFDLGEALQAYVYANTPDYLARRLRKTVLVKQLISLYDYDTLKSTTAAVENKNPADRSVEELALAYACVVALYEKDKARTNALLSATPLANLKWALHMQPVESPTTFPTSQMTVKVQPAGIRDLPGARALGDPQTYYRIPPVTRQNQSLPAPATATNLTLFKFKIP